MDLSTILCILCTTDPPNSSETNLLIPLILTFPLIPIPLINITDEERIPPIIELIPEIFRQMSKTSQMVVMAYTVLFIVGVPSNLSIFFSVGREVWRPNQLMMSRIKLLYWNLASADLVVCCVVIPIEVVWRLTVQWYGGDLLCKVAQFFRAFGLYLSSMVVICISLDRFFSILFPLWVIPGMNNRVIRMLWVSWVCAIIFAVPQLVIFSVQGTALFPTFKQCTSFGYFTTMKKEVTYNLLSLAAMYFIPLLIIIVTYVMVFCKIATNLKYRPSNLSIMRGSNGLRTSENAQNIQRSTRNKALFFSMIIITGFVICWTPYVIMIMWYMIDFETAEKLVDPRIREVLFITVVSNSIINPLIYGKYFKKNWRKFSRCCTTEKSHEMFNSFSAAHTQRSTTTDGFVLRSANNVSFEIPLLSLNPSKCSRPLTTILKSTCV